KLVNPDEKSRVTFFMPADGPSQRIYDERVSAEGMRFFIRPRDGNRVAVALGKPDEGSRLTYRFSLQTLPTQRAELPKALPALGTAEAAQLADLLGPEEAIQSDADAIVQLLRELEIGKDDRVEALRRIHAFIVDDVETTDGHDGAQDALAVLGRERGGIQGKARAEVAMLRAVGIPARVVAGVPLAERGAADVIHWVEARLDGRFWPLDPTRPLDAPLEERLVLHLGDGIPIDPVGVEKASLKVSMLREREAQFQIYQRRIGNSDRLLDKLSLYSLPVKTRVLYQVLLLVPLGALVVAVFRNLVGVPTFGTFMPILVSLAFRESGVGWGLLLFGAVVAVGYVGRHLLDRAQLLMVPRLSFLLTLVILIIAGIMVAAEHLGSDKAFSIALFPIVIITMTIERLSIAIVEEGPRNAAKLVVGTFSVALVGYWVIASDTLQHFVFTFPEIHLVTLAVLLLLGRYTGYRLSEWTRFRAFRTGSLES
ncbi:MAG TPA: 7TM domain-containing protein, partial [Vulgatibacter sp.]